MIEDDRHTKHLKIDVYCIFGQLRMTLFGNMRQNLIRVLVQKNRHQSGQVATRVLYCTPLLLLQARSVTPTDRAGNKYTQYIVYPVIDLSKGVG